MLCASLVTLSLGAFPGIPANVEKNFDSVANFVSGAAGIVAEAIAYKETIKANIPDCNSISSSIRDQFKKDVLDEENYAFPKSCQTKGLKALCEIGKGSDTLIAQIGTCENTVSSFITKIEGDIGKDWAEVETCFDTQVAKGANADFAEFQTCASKLFDLLDDLGDVAKCFTNKDLPTTDIWSSCMSTTDYEAFKAILDYIATIPGLLKDAVSKADGVANAPEFVKAVNAKLDEETKTLKTQTGEIAAATENPNPNSASLFSAYTGTVLVGMAASTLAIFMA